VSDGMIVNRLYW